MHASTQRWAWKYQNYYSLCCFYGSGEFVSIIHLFYTSVGARSPQNEFHARAFVGFEKENKLQFANSFGFHFNRQIFEWSISKGTALIEATDNDRYCCWLLYTFLTIFSFIDKFVIKFHSLTLKPMKLSSNVYKYSYLLNSFIHTEQSGKLACKIN